MHRTALKLKQSSVGHQSSSQTEKQKSLKWCRRRKEESKKGHKKCSVCHHKVHYNIQVTVMMGSYYWYPFWTPKGWEFGNAAQRKRTRALRENVRPVPKQSRRAANIASQEAALLTAQDSGTAPRGTSTQCLLWEKEVAAGNRNPILTGRERAVPTEWEPQTQRWRISSNPTA